MPPEIRYDAVSERSAATVIRAYSGSFGSTSLLPVAGATLRGRTGRSWWLAVASALLLPSLWVLSGERLVGRRLAGRDRDQPVRRRSDV